MIGFTLRGSGYLEEAVGPRKRYCFEIREETPMSKGSGSGDDTDLPQAAKDLMENAAKEQIPARLVELAEQLEKALSGARKGPETKG